MIFFWKVLKNMLVIEFGCFFLWMGGKCVIYCVCFGMEIGEKIVIVYKVMLDLFFLEKIMIGENLIIGYYIIILMYEYLFLEYCVGEVVIGWDVMVGVNVIIFLGIVIGDGVVIVVGVVVLVDVLVGSFVYGNLLIIKEKVILM